MKHIKLFDNINEAEKPAMLDSFEEAESKLFGKKGIVLKLKGDIVKIEKAIEKIPHESSYVLITQQKGHNPESWESDVFLVGATGDGMTIKDYFNNDDEKFTDPAGGTHRDGDDPASAYESTVSEPLFKYLKKLSELLEGGSDDRVKQWKKILRHEDPKHPDPEERKKKWKKALKHLKHDGYESLTEGTLISKRNMDLDSFKSQGSFFNREPHSNDSPVHSKSITELNEERKSDFQREVENIIERYKTKMDAEEIHDVLELLMHRMKNEF